jgi:hypothetical protein
MEFTQRRVVLGVTGCEFPFSRPLLGGTIGVAEVEVEGEGMAEREVVER